MTTTQNELILTESRIMRAETIKRTEVLDKVKALSMLPDGIHATVEIVASYFGSTVDAIEKIVQRNRVELEENGYTVLRGAEYRAFAADNLSAANPKSRKVALFTRRAILNVGQLLTESEVAKTVRTYLLELEEAATPEQRSSAVEKATVAEAQLRAIEVLARIGGNASYARGLSRHVAARMLGQEAEIDPLDITITADEYLAEKGVHSSDLASARTRLGKTVAALYRARHSKDPQKIKRPIHGVHRDVAVYTHADIDLFDTAWAEVGKHYTVQSSIDLDGAA